jgi:hypothetical protein
LSTRKSTRGVDSRRNKNGVGHAVQELFIVGTNRRKRPATDGCLFAYEVIRAQSHPAPHPPKFTDGGVEVIMLNQPPLMELLENMRMRVELSQGLLSSACHAAWASWATTTPEPRHVRKPLIFELERAVSD